MASARVTFRRGQIIIRLSSDCHQIVIGLSHVQIVQVPHPRLKGFQLGRRTDVGRNVMAEAAHGEVQEESPELSAASKVVALRAEWCENVWKH